MTRPTLLSASCSNPEPLSPPRPNRRPPYCPTLSRCPQRPNRHPPATQASARGPPPKPRYRQTNPALPPPLRLAFTFALRSPPGKTEIRRILTDKSPPVTRRLSFVFEK